LVYKFSLFAVIFVVMNVQFLAGEFRKEIKFKKLKIKDG
jgi:hypothetical protein